MGLWGLTGARCARCVPERLAHGTFSVSSFDGDDDDNFLRLLWGSFPCSGKLFFCGHLEARWSFSTSSQELLLTSVAKNILRLSSSSQHWRGRKGGPGKVEEGAGLSGCLRGGAEAGRSWLSGCPLTPPASPASEVAPQSPAGAGVPRVPPWKHARNAGDLSPSAHFTAEL